MSSTYHGDQFQLRRRTTISKPSASTSGSENQRTPTSPLLSGRSQSPTEPRRSLDDGDTVQARPSEATERHHLSPSADNGYARPAGTGFSGRPKPITRSGWLKFVTGWSVHFPALISTIAVVIYSRKRQYWYSEEGIKWPRDRHRIFISADAMNNVLQLPTKIHELLIVASLSSIALAMFRRRLITDGVRLGFLTGGYRVGDLDYLRTMAFWRQGVDLNRPWEILLAGFVVFATILTIIVGPTSATLLLPTLGWYPLEHESAFSEVRLPLLYHLDRESIWPQTIVDGQPPFDQIGFCKGIDTTYHPFCPAGGFSELYAWAYSFRASDINDSLKVQYPAINLRRELVSLPSDHSEVNSTTLCTTPPHFLMASVGLFWDYVDEKRANVGEISNTTRYRFKIKQTPTKGDILQPLVQSKCRLTDPSEHPNTQQLNQTFDKAIQYPIEHLECFDDQDCLKLNFNRRFVNNYTTPWLSHDRWQDESVTSGFATSKGESSVLTLVGQLPEKGNNSVYVCNFLASWVNSTFTVDPKESDILKSTLSENEILWETFYRNGSSKPEVIRFDKSTAQYLMPPLQWRTQDTEGVRPWSPLDQIVKLFATPCKSSSNRSFACLEPIVNGDPREIEAFLSKIFGVYLTEFLARTAVGYRIILKRKEEDNRLVYLELDNQFGRNSGEQELEFVNETYTRNVKTKQYVPIWRLSLNSSLPIDFEVERYGYGSGQTGRTVDFALAIMSIYLAVVAVYATAVGIRHVLEFFHFSRPGRPVRLLSVIPWSDLQDLIVLALKTSPPTNPNLMDSGAGVSSDRAWENVVRARTDDELNVQLVLDDRKRTKSLDYTGATRYY
ncbi:hypothetical protein CPLU01_11714 [Colletotrichum plurivorum]|uniref:Uncharacterized protein n=1 Tax=Colletotrichum plurivorum TaxID=2175906 RepID=A0A8H6N853_9PEZI|nr:hypothetical protein CPLU01_11714 [Colletotrichum plurivorum]